MLKNLWYRIYDWFAGSGNAHHVMYQELITTEYKSILYALHRASTLHQLIELRKRIRELQQLLIESRLEYWGRPHIIDLTKLWNAKFRYWKDKARSH